MADRVALGNAREPGSIQLGEIRALMRTDPADPMPHGIGVSFKNVVGTLSSKGLPAGFILFDQAGKPQPICYKVRLEGNTAILETALPPRLISAIAYGHGYNPICNVGDARGMAVPQFGPLPVRGQKGSAFLVNWKISGPFEGQEVRSAQYPALDTLEWRAPYSVEPILVMPQDVKAPKPGLFFLRTAIRVAAARLLKLSMGADSPYRIWINGRETAENLTATNPSVPDEFPKQVDLQAGRSEIVVAFDGRNGMGWGISMRFMACAPRANLDPAVVMEES